MKVTFEAMAATLPVSLSVNVLLSKVTSASTTLVRLNRMLPVVLLLKTLLLKSAVIALLLATISIGISETEVCPSKVLFEQVRVDVPSRVNLTPLVFFKN